MQEKIEAFTLIKILYLQKYQKPQHEISIIK